MHSAAFYAGVLLISLLHQVSGEIVTALYGETIKVPCLNGNYKPEDIFIVKWKYETGDEGGKSGDLLVKAMGNTTIAAGDEYKDRVSLAEDLSLLIAKATLADQKVFTCMLVIESDIFEQQVHVVVQKAPSAPEIAGSAQEMEIGKLTTLGECSAHGANPAASIAWYKNNETLVDDGTAILIAASVKVDPDTGLSSTSSKLQYTAVKGDTGAKFTCAAKHSAGADLVSSPVTVTINYPTEKVSLQVVPQGPFQEGDNVTLRCQADGNPPPSSYSFHIKGKKVTVENSDTFTLAGVTRASSGEYKCSMIDDNSMEATDNITVDYLDVSLSPSGEVTKKAGESLAVALQQESSRAAKVFWTKDNGKLDSLPKFDKLKYSDSGRYDCEVTMAGLVRRNYFELLVEGVPVIKSLSKQRSDDGNYKVLTCEAEGVPKPSVAWSVNGTDAGESSSVDGMITHTLTVVPRANLTVSCMVFNDLGQDTKTINVSSLFEEVTVDRQDQPEDSNDSTKLVLGVVVGLILASVAVGLAYWFYTKKFKQGSWKMGEKEDGTHEESKKLEASQKAKV